MTGRVRTLVFVAVLAVSVAAVGGAVAADPGDHCTGVSGPSIVGVVADESYGPGDDPSLHPGSTLEVVYCEDGDPRSGDWLNASEVAGVELLESGAASYEFELTGEHPEIAFADHADVAEYEDSPDGVVVTVPTAGTDLEGGDVDDALVDAYLEAAADFENATDELNATTETIADGEESELTAADETLETLEQRHETMTEQERRLIDHVIDETRAGNATGTFGTLETIGAERSERTAALETATDSYRSAVADERAEPQSTVRLSLFGSLLGGLLVGLVAGAAVPLVAARRVEEKMKLSRDVSYDRRVALVPILVGLALAIAGAAVLAVVVGGVELLEVIR